MTVQRAGTQDARVTEAMGLSRMRLAWLQVTHRRGWAAALWLCLVATVAMPAVLPLIAAMAVESQLADILASDGGLTVGQSTPGVDAFAALQRSVDLAVSARTGDAMVPVGGSGTGDPLSIASVNEAPAPRQTAAALLTPVFADDLARHVVVVAGELPPEALGGETAVTLPQAGADQIGLHLSDVFCAGFAGANGPRAAWCARVAGLWQPTDPRDPYWGGRPPRLQVSMGRYDFFQLLRQRQPPGTAQATLRYWADPQAVGVDRASSLAAQVRALRQDLRSPGRTVTTVLDASLARYDDRRRGVSAAIQLLGAAVTLLGLFVVTLVGARFLDGQAGDLAVMRARGWPRRRVWRVITAGMAVLAVGALPAGIAVSALILYGLGLTGSGLTPRWLHPDDVAVAAAMLVASAVVLAAVLGVLAARVVSREVEPTLEAPFRTPASGPPSALTVLLLVLVGLPALCLPRLPGVDQLTGGAPPWAAGIIALAPALGLVLLTGAAVRLYPLSWAAPGRRGVGGILAGWQLERRPEQHAGAAFVLVLAAAIAIFAALGVAAAYAAQGADSQPVLQVGLQAGLLLGAAVGLGLALAAQGLHFRSTARRRLREYGGLFAHGLPPRQLARSLAAEQVATARASLLIGTLLGLALGLVALPLPGSTDRLAPFAVAAVAAAGACLLAGSLTVGSVSRRLPARINPLGQGQP